MRCGWPTEDRTVGGRRGVRSGIRPVGRPDRFDCPLDEGNRAPSSACSGAPGKVADREVRPHPGIPRSIMFRAGFSRTHPGRVGRPLAGTTPHGAFQPAASGLQGGGGSPRSSPPRVNRDGHDRDDADRARRRADPSRAGGSDGRAAADRGGAGLRVGLLPERNPCPVFRGPGAGGGPDTAGGAAGADGPEARARGPGGHAAGGGGDRGGGGAGRVAGGRDPRAVGPVPRPSRRDPGGGVAGHRRRPADGGDRRDGRRGVGGALGLLARRGGAERSRRRRLAGVGAGGTLRVRRRAPC